MVVAFGGLAYELITTSDQTILEVDELLKED